MKYFVKPIVNTMDYLLFITWHLCLMVWHFKLIKPKYSIRTFYTMNVYGRNYTWFFSFILILLMGLLIWLLAVTQVWSMLIPLLLIFLVYLFCLSIVTHTFE